MPTARVDRPVRGTTTPPREPRRPTADPRPRPASPVAWRQHLSFWLIGAAVVGTLFVLWSLVSELALLLGLLAVALFFTVVLTPFVDRVQQRLHVRRTLATLVVFVIGTVVVAGIVFLFVQPIAGSSSDLGRELPKLVRDAEHGRGRIGHVLRDLGVQGWVHDNLPAIRKSLGRSDGPLFQAGVAVVSGVVATITIMVLVFLMLVEGPIFSAAVLDLFPPTRAERIRRVGTDAARAMSGYAVGNLAISGLAGVSAYVTLRLLGVPFALVLAVWVAFADLIPLVGATLGALPHDLRRAAEVAGHRDRGASCSSSCTSCSRTTSCSRW